MILCKQAKSLQCFSLPTQKAIIFDLFSNNEQQADEEANASTPRRVRLKDGPYQNASKFQAVMKN